MRDLIMKKIAILMALSILSACASKSQNAQISIFPSVKQSNIGKQKPILITVDDLRSSGIIGELGNGDKITTSQGLSETIGLALIDAFSKQGFNVGDVNNMETVQLEVSLEELSYTKNGNTVTTDVETKSKVKVAVKKKGFERTYSNSEQRTIPFSSNEDTNNSQLSSTLGTIIDKIVNDMDLMAAMVR